MQFPFHDGESCAGAALPWTQVDKKQFSLAFGPHFSQRAARNAEIANSK
jgi:hypothetical protein